jgi:AraC-like DNA-binding protein
LLYWDLAWLLEWQRGLCVCVHLPTFEYGMPQFLMITLIFLAALHLYNNWRIQPHSLYLSGALLFITYYFIVHYLFIYGTSTFWLAVLFGHGTPMIYLIGPMLFFYVRGVLNDEHRLKRSDVWHFLPAIFDLFTRIPYFLKPWSFKIWMAGELVKDIRHMHDFADVFFPPSYFSFPARLVSMIGYTVYCLWMVWQFRRHYEAGSRIPIQIAKVPIRFLFYLLGVSLLTDVSILVLLLMFLSDKSMAVMQVTQNPLLLISFLGLLSIPVIIQLHPEVLYGIPRWRSGSPTDMSEDAQECSLDDDPLLSEKDEPSAEAETKFRALAQRIGDTMEQEKLFLQPDFSLEDLSRAMDVPKQHLYYCFNHILQKRFTQLRAELRIQYACSLIRNGATEKKTLEAIGLESGFSNRSSFINTFRDFTGMTPSEYQRSVEEV